VSLLCKIAGVSRSGYYKWLERKQCPSTKQLEDQVLKEKIMDCYHRLNGIYGYLRVKVWLQMTFGIQVNHKRVYRLMKELGIRAPNKGRAEVNVVSDNILNRDFQAAQPNKKWVTDITYLPLQGKWHYCPPFSIYLTMKS
jgi:transposase InsO family protein